MSSGGLSVLADGWHVLRVCSEDAAEALPYANATFQVDTLPPVVSLLSSVAPWTNQAAVNVCVTAVDVFPVKLVASLMPGFVSTSVVTGCFVDPALAEDAVAFSVYGIDGAGNVGVPVAASWVTVYDATPLSLAWTRTGCVADCL
jgi:hypothetical protein